MMNKIWLFEFSDKLYNNLSIILISAFSVLLIVGALLSPTQPIGESYSYMLPTISIENRFSLFINLSDIEQAKIDFPEHIHAWSNYNLHPTTQSGIFHPYYFGTYTIVCMPMKIMLREFGFSQSLAFSLTNSLLYIIALWVVFLKLKLSRKNVLLTLLMLICNPAIFYIIWPSAEIFIFSNVIISLVFFSNNQYKLSAFFISLAASLQPTLLIFGLIIIINYIIDNQLFNFSKQQISNWEGAKSKLIKLFKLGLCFIPAVFPFFYTYYHFNKISLNMFSDLTDYKYRLFAYLFDLNFGFLPYFPLSFTIFLILILIGLVKLNLKAYLYFFAFFGVIATYSIAYHINCGMTGIARYNVWVFPIAIFFIVTQYERLIKNNIYKRLIVPILIVSSIYTFSVVKVYGLFKTYFNFTEMSYIAKKILDNYPSLYNPYPYTFVSRIYHVDGGYNYIEPVIYSAQDGFAKKALVTKETASLLNKMLIGSAYDLEYLQNEIDRVKKRDGFDYINFNKRHFLKVNQFPDGKVVIKSYDPRLQTPNGIRSKKHESVRCSGISGYLAIGPNLDLKAGAYELIVKGHLSGKSSKLGYIEIISLFRNIIIQKEDLFSISSLSDSIIKKLNFTIDVEQSDVNFRLFVNDSVLGFFSEYELRMVDKY
jgi:hypothetical protein